MLISICLDRLIILLHRNIKKYYLEFKTKQAFYKSG